ncbi:MAG: hypothetical protein G01um101433_67 [Parcubacteria group bacterium Gr01-1014_33]|nr:MAG: hypothetical protein G01um101433_67 [Parcubacteria group bacterium Gr01-1014_33]
MDEHIGEIKRYKERFFEKAHFVIIDESSFSIKIRLIIAKDIFVEIRINIRNNRKSYVVIKEGKRIAGFDNFGGWHIHPFENPEAHRSYTVIDSFATSWHLMLKVTTPFILKYSMKRRMYE